MNVTELLTREQCEALGKKVFAMVPAGMKATLSVYNTVSVGTNFVRGEAHIAREIGVSHVMLDLAADDRRSSVISARLDDEGLRQLVAEAVRTSRTWRGKPEPVFLSGAQQYKAAPDLFFDANLPVMAAVGRGAVIDAALSATEAAGLVGAGQVWVWRTSRGIMNTEGLFGYNRNTNANFSLTARTKDGTGSGWAWNGYEDWSRNDIKGVIARAIDLALRSRNPVAVEPGRYTVILEPPAIAELLYGIDWLAQHADLGMSVFSKEPIGTNKIGLQMIDRRLNMVADPWDPEAPHSTIGGGGEPLDKVQFFRNGILVNLLYPAGYAKLKNRPVSWGPETLRLYGDGPTQTLEEMIASTKRGIWVNRLSGIVPMSFKTQLLTGTTRDGTFLIENGKITKPIKNFRFMESPFFILNKLEAFGEPVRARHEIVAPRVKVRDFDFTSLTDAV